MRRLILLTALLLALPLCSVHSFQAFGKVEVGKMIPVGGKGGFTISAGTNAVLLTAPEKNTRLMQFVGIIHSDTPEDVKGASSFTQIEKYLQLGKVQPYLSFGSGFVWQPKDTTADLIDLDLKVEVGLHVINWFSVGAGLNFIPVSDGPNLLNPYISLNLISPMQ